jgi:sugar phosphate isomerase/epimerase
VNDSERPAHRMLSLAAGVVLDIGPADTVDAAARSGWPAVGIWFDPAAWTASVADDVRRRLDATGLTALDIEPVMLSARGDAGERIVEAAQIISARNILVASRDDDHGRVAARLADLAALLPPTGIRLVLEFLPALGVRSLREADAIVDAVGDPRVGVLIDSLHLSRAGESPADAAAVVARDPARLPYVQLADAPAAPPATDPASLIDEALHGRLLPGDGGLPLRALLDAVPGVPVSVELRSRALMTGFPDPVERAAAVLAATRRLA